MALPPKKPGAPRLVGPTDTVPAAMETGKERLANAQLTDLVEALEEELGEVKVKYEMFFIGAERMEPSRRRDDLKRDIARLKNAFTRNAGLRFRIQALAARYLSYERLWLRSAKEKEAGTYRRDVLKARRKAADRGEAKDSGAASSAAGLPPPPERAEPPPAMGEAEMRALFESYVAAKRSCNEDVSRLTLESLTRTVNKQAPEIAARFKAKKVEFKVAVRDGRAVLTAVPRT